VTDRLEQIKTEYGEYAEGIATYEVEVVNWLINEVEQWRANYQVMLEANEENVKLVERLRGQAERLHELHGEALVTIATLREALEAHIPHLEKTLLWSGTFLGEEHEDAEHGIWYLLDLTKKALAVTEASQ